MSVRLALLGQPQIICETCPIFLPAKAVGLLAYLATHTEPQPRERIMELLWPERDPEAGRKNLRNTLWVVRRALGANAVTSRADRLALGANVWVDTQVFSQTVAPDLYRGPFLDGLAFDDAPDFEQWIAVEQAHWQARFYAVTEGITSAQHAKHDQMHAESLAFALSNAFSQFAESPYQPVSTLMMLARGWNFALEGSLIDAQEVFEAVYATAQTDNPLIASQSCLELAVIHLRQDAYEEAAQWMEQAGTFVASDVPTQRLAHGIMAVLEARQFDQSVDMRGAATWFTQQYLLELLVGSRCALMQQLTLQGDFALDLQMVMQRFITHAR